MIFFTDISNALIIVGPSRFSIQLVEKILCNSYTMGCPPVRGDNPRA